MKTMKTFSKRMLSILLSLLMVVTMLPTFAITASAKEAPTSDYWQILASTDFTGTAWAKSSDYVWYTTTSPTTSKGGYSLGWNTQTYDNESSANTVDSAGIHFDNSDYRGLLALSSFKIGDTKYDNSNYRSLFQGVSSFKIDLTFSYTGNSYGQGGTLDSRQNGSPLLKLSKDTDGKLKFNDRECWNQMYFTQEAYGRRHIDGNKDIGKDSTEGGIYNISTYNSTGSISANNELHYIVYIADGWLGCYLTDASGNTLINFDPIDISDYSLSPADITSIYLGGSRFSWSNHSDLSNVAYKSIEIYQGNGTTVPDQSSRTKYLYTYFTGNSTNGESLHYAVSEDGINFKPVNNGLPVWDSSARSIEGSYPSDVGTAASKHVRDPYVLQKRTAAGVPTTGYYILATDLNTQNGSNWGNNSKMLVYSIDNLTDIDTATPWEIDTQAITAVSTLTGGSVSRAWAPQAIWDPAVGKYMLYWSIGYVSGQTKLYYLYTSDFKTDLASATVKQLVFPSFCNSFIDADITFYNGLYYMFYKDEDAKKIYRAIAPSASGPYQGSTKFSDTGMEGPQLYELANDGSYALMTDVYGEGNYYIYRASVPRNLNESTTATTNINYLHPRHGSVMRITPAEYDAIVSEYGTLAAGTVEYLWASDTSNSGNEMGYQSIKDPGGHVYDICYGQSYSDSGGYITLNSTNVFINDDTAREIFQSDAYTINFTHKLTDSTKNTSTYTAFAIGTPLRDYVRITENGEFYVNGSSAGSFTLSPNVEYDITVTFNGYATCLLVQGGTYATRTYIGGALNTTPMVKENGYCYIALGWSDATGSRTSRQTTAQYGKLTVSPIATETGHDDDFVNDLCSESDVADSNIKTFTANAYFTTNVATNGFNNVLYCAQTVEYNSSKNGTHTDNYGRCKNLSFKFIIPTNIVLAYDGVNTPALPIEMETKMYKGSWNTDYKPGIITVYFKGTDDSGTNMSSFRNDHWWYGFLSGDWTSWAGASKTESNHDNYTGYAQYYDHDTGTQDNNNTGRFWWNKLNYQGSFADDEYSQHFTHLTFGVYSYNKNTSASDEFVRNDDGNVYVVNYKPIYDILKSSSPTTIDLDGVGSLPAKNIREVRDYLVNGDGKWMYTSASKAEALRRLAAVGDVNPNTYSYSSGVSAAVSSCATDIQNAYNNYIGIPSILVKRTFTINYQKYGGVNASESVTAGNTLASIPANTAKAHISGSNYHWEYNWTSSTGVWNSAQTPSGSHVPHSNETYIETRGANAVHCSYTDWNAAWDTAGNGHDGDGWTHTAAAGDTNGYSTSTCSVCSGHETVYDAHDTEWQTYESNVVLQNSSRYTTSSKSVYTNAIESTVEGVEAYDETKSKSFIDTKNTALATAASTYLNPLAEYETLDSALESRSADRATNNYSAGAQLYTYDSWVNFASKYAAGDTLLNSTYTAADKADQGKFDVNGSNEVTNTKSSYQTAIETNSANVTGATLTAVGNAEQYDAYEAAITTINAQDKNKYTEDGLAALAALRNSTDAVVYHTLANAAEATAYNSYTGGNFAAGDRIKNATSGIDTQTANLLDNYADINDTDEHPMYIKKFRATFTIQNNGNAVYSAPAQVAYYGESFSFTVPNEPVDYTAKSKVYTVSTYDGVADDAMADAVSSTKFSYGNTIERIASSNVAITADLKDTGTGANKYSILNAYGKVVQIVYADSEDAAKEAIDTNLLAIPFYTLNGYYPTTTVSAGAYNIRAKYEVAPTRYLITVAEGTLTDVDENGTALYDDKVTITEYTGSDTFVAWAVKKDDTYQIASYEETYSFFVSTHEAFVPIIKSGDNYYAKSGSTTQLTPSNVEGAPTAIEGFTAQQLLNAKLANERPFASISVTATATSGGVTKKSAYVRATYGAEGVRSYGVSFDKGSGYPATPYAISNVLSTKQYLVNVKNNSTVKFKATVTYDMTLNVDGKDTTLTFTDYGNEYTQA